MLIESEDTHQQLDCGLINSEYKKLNGKLACYGFDVPIDKNRELYGIYSEEMRALYQLNARIIKDKRLFLVAGASHLDINRNFFLKEINSSQVKTLKFK